jgi:4'-phosphopantetheinyl transferase
VQALDRFLAPPPGLALPAAGEVHVWRIDLERPAAAVDRWAALLAPDEAARAARFRFARHRRRFTVARGVVRELVGRYLGSPPEEVAFAYGANGKPHLAPPAGARLALNVTHSAELAVVAFSAAVELGVDVERRRAMPRALEIAARFFSPAERRALAALPPAARDDAFFRCWTRKEAYLKAVGDGLTVRLAGFDVTLGPGDPPRLLAIDGDPGRAAAWELAHLEPAAGYLGALVVPARPAGPWRLTGWRAG